MSATSRGYRTKLVLSSTRARPGALLLACARGLRLRRPHRATRHRQLQVGPLPRRPAAAVGRGHGLRLAAAGGRGARGPCGSRRLRLLAGARLPRRGDRRPPREPLRLAHRRRVDRVAAERRAGTQPGLRRVRRARRGRSDRHACVPAVSRCARRARPKAGHRTGRTRGRPLGAPAGRPRRRRDSRRRRAPVLPSAQPARPRLAPRRGRAGRRLLPPPRPRARAATRSTATSSSTTGRTCRRRSPAPATRTGSSR